MSLINKKYNVSELAEIGTNGFTAASFPQIRDAVASKMKEIYGNDIDLSSASADGQYVNMEALILNNVYRTLESLAKSLNPADASGKYLDILASFSGAFRRQPTNSVAQLYVWNTGAADISPDQIVCMDKSGNEWVWYNPVDYNGQKTVTIPSMLGTPTNYVPYGPLEFRCKSFGSVSASGDPNPSASWQTIYERSPDVRGGDIYQTIDAGNFQVYQKNAAIAGKDLESDSSLRSRRNLSFGISGATVQNSLIANLLDIEGVDDVWVFNNNTSGNQTMDDGVSVAQHDVYVVVWKDPSLNLSDATFNEAVGSAIYDQLTPGVLTTTHGLNPMSVIYFQLPFALTDSKNAECVYAGTGFTVSKASGSPDVPVGSYILIDTNSDDPDPAEWSAIVVGKNLWEHDERYTLEVSPGGDEEIECEMATDFGLYGLFKNYIIPLSANINTSVCWKQCCEMAPSIRIKGKVLNQSDLSSDQKAAIFDSLITYFNNIKLDEYVYGTEASMSAQSADFRTTQYGLPTYMIESIEYCTLTLGGGVTWHDLVSRKLPLTRFNYDRSNNGDYYSFEIDGSGNITIYLNCSTSAGHYVPWTFAAQS